MQSQIANRKCEGVPIAVHGTGGSRLSRPTTGGARLSRPTTGGSRLSRPTTGGARLSRPTTGGSSSRSTGNGVGKTDEQELVPPYHLHFLHFYTAKAIPHDGEAPSPQCPTTARAHPSSDRLRGSLRSGDMSPLHTTTYISTLLHGQGHSPRRRGRRRHNAARRRGAPL